MTLAAVGVFPAYHEKAQAGLSLLDRRGHTLFTVRQPVHAYQRMEDIPPVVVHALLYIENRELLEAGNPSRNPAIKWDRLARAVFDLGRHAVDPGHPASGGSTLATQLAKLRHSPGGRTLSAADKGRQMLARVTWLNLILSVWLIVAPAVFGSFATDRIAAADDISVGVLLIAASWWILAARTAVLCGVWLIIAPFVLRYRGLSYTAMNDHIVGAIVVIVSLFETWALVRAPIKAA